MLNRGLAFANKPPNPAAMLALQEDLVRAVISSERSIRRFRLEERAVRHALATDRTRPKSDARVLKDRIASLVGIIQRHQVIIEGLRIVADTVAFTYLDPWDIKPYSFKERSGFLAGRSGLRAELRALRQLSHQGHPTILNDLTNCLRHGDVTVLAPSPPWFHVLEVKAGRPRGKRFERQVGAIQQLAEYMETDTTTDLFGLPGPFIRRATHAAPIYHHDAMRRAVGGAYEHGTGIEYPERGVAYLAITKSEPEQLASLVANFSRPMLCTISASKPWPHGYRPLSIALSDSSATVDWLVGELVIIVLVDIAVLLKGFQELNIEPAFDGAESRPIKLLHPSVDAVAGPIVTIGDHALGRVFFEALSLQWFINECASVPYPPPEGATAIGASNDALAEAQRPQ